MKTLKKKIKNIKNGELYIYHLKGDIYAIVKTVFQIKSVHLYSQVSTEIINEKINSIFLSEEERIYLKKYNIQYKRAIDKWALVMKDVEQFKYLFDTFKT
jgi:hypothetical protein